VGQEWEEDKRRGPGGIPCSGVSVLDPRRSEEKTHLNCVVTNREKKGETRGKK